MNRREEILSCVTEIFKEQGIHTNFTMSSLAKQLDIGKSTIYEYFDNKEEVVTEAFLKIINGYIDEILARQLDETDSFEKSLKEEIEYLLTVASSSRILTGSMMPNLKQLIPDAHRDLIMSRMQEIMAFYQKHFESIFIKGVEEGVIKNNQDQYVSLLVSSIISGSVLRINNPNLPMDNEFKMKDYIDRVYDTILMMINK